MFAEKVDELEKYKKWLIDNDSNRREDAIHILHHADLRDDEVDSALMAILSNDADAKCRCAAVKFIVDINDVKFKQVMIKSLSDEFWKVRGYAYLGLKMLPQDFDIIAAMNAFEDKEKDLFCLFCINEN